MKNKKLLLITAAFLAGSISANAGDRYFTRGLDKDTGSMNWEDNFNWSTAATTVADNYYTASGKQAAAPTSSDRVYIAAGSGYAGSDTSGDRYIVLGTDVQITNFDIASYSPNTTGMAYGVKGTGSITLSGSNGNVIRHVVANTLASTTNFVDFDIGVDFVIKNAKTGNIGAYWRSGKSLTFSGDTFKVEYTDAAIAANSTFYLYAGNNEANHNIGNSGFIFDTKIITSRMTQYSSVSRFRANWTGYFLEVTMKGNTSNELGTYCVSTDSVLNLAKTGGANAFNAGSTLEITQHSTVNVLGNNQFSNAANIKFAAPEVDASNNKIAGYLNMNGYNVEINKLQLAGSVDIARDLTYTGYVEGIIDFGSNSAAQTFSMESGIEVVGNGYNFELNDSKFIIKNFHVGEDKIVSGTQLSTQWVGDLAGAEVYALDLLSFEGYDMDLYSITETQNGGYWEYSLAIPEPSTYAAIFGIFALGFAAYRRRK